MEAVDPPQLQASGGGTHQAGATLGRCVGRPSPFSARSVSIVFGLIAIYRSTYECMRIIGKLGFGNMALKQYLCLFVVGHIMIHCIYHYIYFSH